MASNSRWTKGHSAGVAAFTIWGIFPLYWKIFSNLDSLALTIWRFLFTAITLILIVTFLKQWRLLSNYLKNLKVLQKLIVAGILISTNWLIFMWAVSHQLTWQSSLGYYISPLITVGLGAIVLKENLKFNTKLALTFAAMGIFLFLYHTGELPMVSLILATTFSFYGFMKKSVSLPPHLSMTFETMMTIPLCLAYFALIPIGTNHNFSIFQWLLLSLSGILTILPMFFYNFSAQRIPLNNLGMLQFISPTLQFLTAEFIFHEDIDTYKLYSFAFIWIAVLIYLFGPFIWKFFKVNKA